MNLFNLDSLYFDPANAAKLFIQKADTNKDGAVSQSEMTAQFRTLQREILYPANQGTGWMQSYSPRNALASAMISSLSGFFPQIYDSRDLNQDGTVSYMEQMLFDFSHPDLSQNTRAGSNEQSFNAQLQADVSAMITNLQMGTTYDAQGKLSTSTSGVQSLFSLYA